MIGKVTEGRYVGASVHKVPDKNIIFIRTEEGSRIGLTEKNVISIDDVTTQYPSVALKTIMVLWNNFETSIIQIGTQEHERLSTEQQKEKARASTMRREVENQSESEHGHPKTISHELAKEKHLAAPQRKNSLVTVIITACVTTMLLLAVFATCLHIGILQIALPREGDADAPVLSQQETNPSTVSPKKDLKKPSTSKASLEYGFIDAEPFSQYWIDGIFRCGTDLHPGDYYVLPLYAPAAGYEIGTSPNDLRFSGLCMLKKVTLKEGQFIKVDYGGIIVPAEEVDTKNWTQYGVFLVGRDLPAGNYKMEILTNRYQSSLYSLDVYAGCYQISDGAPGNIPIECEYLHESQKYVALEEGQYLIISNIKLTPV